MEERENDLQASVKQWLSVNLKFKNLIFTLPQDTGHLNWSSVYGWNPNGCADKVRTIGQKQKNSYFLHCPYIGFQ